MKLLHIDKVKTNRSAFETGVRSLSAKINIDPNWIMEMMDSESGLNEKEQNTKFPFKNGLATGLIQFTPDTAISLGTTVQDLLQMSNVEQLYYVEKYFRDVIKNFGPIKSYLDLYFANFFPLAIGKGPDWVFQTKKLSASKIAASNPAFDMNKDGKLTVSEVQEYMMKRVYNKVPQEYWKNFKKKV